MNLLGTTHRPATKALPYVQKMRFSKGFTLAELMAVVTIMAILSAILLPALNKGKTRSKAISCLNNLRQLQLAWQMFPDDHSGDLPANDYVDGIKFGSANTYIGDSWAPGNPKMDFTTANIERGQLFEYTRNANIYRCPADSSKVDLPTGSDPVLRTRSYSMSSSINSQVTANLYPSFRREGEMENRNVARLFVFIDAHPDSITDGHFAVDPGSKKWVNVPSDRHGQAGNLSFADGHIERWNWLAKKEFAGWPTTPASTDPKYVELDGRDLERLQSVVRKD